MYCKQGQILIAKHIGFGSGDFMVSVYIRNPGDTIMLHPMVKTGVSEGHVSPFPVLSTVAIAFTYSYISTVGKYLSSPPIKLIELEFHQLL